MLCARKNCVAKSTKSIPLPGWEPFFKACGTAFGTCVRTRSFSLALAIGASTAILSVVRFRTTAKRPVQRERGEAAVFDDDLANRCVQHVALFVEGLPRRNELPERSEPYDE
jgi:hypothetical protein